MAYIISGIQQAGVGVENVEAAFKWYNEHLGMDIPVFDEAAEAALMLPYTGGKPQSRRAILAITTKGGGGFEIWQYTSRTPVKPTFKAEAGDLGIFIVKVKTDNVQATFDYLKSKQVKLLTNVSTAPSGKKHFYLEDPYGNIFEIVEFDDFFSTGRAQGGVAGAVVGVTNMDRAIAFYQQILGFDKVVFRTNEMQSDMHGVPGANHALERVLLTHSKKRVGPFSELLGRGEIELIAVRDRSPRKIYEGRFWGDPGFIHLCFDIRNMAALKTACEAAGHPFTVDGGAGFEMGEAAGHFTYIEDPDGTLIEFVETKKVPLLKKLGWYLDLRKRPAEKPLPKWMLRTMGLNRKKV